MLALPSSIWEEGVLINIEWYSTYNSRNVELFSFILINS